MLLFTLKSVDGDNLLYAQVVDGVTELFGTAEEEFGVNITITRAERFGKRSLIIHTDLFSITCSSSLSIWSHIYLILWFSQMAVQRMSRLLLPTHHGNWTLTSPGQSIHLEG